MTSTLLWTVPGPQEPQRCLVACVFEPLPQGNVVWFVVSAEASLRTENIVASVTSSLGLSDLQSVSVDRASSEGMTQRCYCACDVYMWGLWGVRGVVHNPASMVLCFGGHPRPRSCVRGCLCCRAAVLRPYPAGCQCCPYCVPSSCLILGSSYRAPPTPVPSLTPHCSLRKPAVRVWRGVSE